MGGMSAMEGDQPAPKSSMMHFIYAALFMTLHEPLVFVT
jgi:hypothetical protein